MIIIEMYYSDPVQLVFDCKDLRHLILTKHVYNKYKIERDRIIREIVDEAIIQHWYRHCSCEECRIFRENVS